jgi:hypothetical protein
MSNQYEWLERMRGEIHLARVAIAHVRQGAPPITSARVASAYHKVGDLVESMQQLETLLEGETSPELRDIVVRLRDGLIAIADSPSEDADGLSNLAHETLQGTRALRARYGLVAKE